MKDTTREQRWTLESLTNEYQNGINNHTVPVFSELASLYCNRTDSAQRIIENMNNIIADYNKLLLDENKVDKKIILDYKKCLFELLGTLMPFMDIDSRLYAYVNRCILADDDSDAESKKFYDVYFRKSVLDANNYLTECWEKVNWDIPTKKKDVDLYYRIGFMNFKIQSYKTAIRFLENCRDAIGKSIGSADDIEKYSECIIYLANSYEYSDDLENALVCLIGMKEKPETASVAQRLQDTQTGDMKPGDEMQVTFSGAQMDALKKNVEEQETAIRDYILSVYKKIENDTCCINDMHKLCLYLSGGDSLPLRVFQLSEDNDNYLELTKSYVHVLAHCLSEYVAKMTQGGQFVFPYYSNLQLITRVMMDCLVAVDDSYVTCQATIRAENDACPEAIDLLLKHYQKRYASTQEEALSAEQKKMRAELEFYIFYFSEQELRFNYQDQKLKEIFNEYGNAFFSYSSNANGEGCPDYDSLFHYWVIQCKFLLKKYAKESLRQGLDSDYSEVDLAFLKLQDCREHISKHVFESLTAEAKRIEGLYHIFRQVRYINRDKIQKQNMMELERLIKCDEHLAGKDLRTVLNEIYNGIELRNRILILAPVHESPSCYFSVRNIESLISFNCEKYMNNTISAPPDAKQGFTEIRRKHTRPYTKRKALLSKANERENVAKLVFYYDENNADNAFLYYKNFRNLDGNYSGEMFPLILCEYEKTELKRLLSELNKEIDKQTDTIQSVECGEHFKEGDTFLGERGTLACFMKMKEYSLSHNDLVSMSVLRLLVFLETDFLSPEKESRIQEGDQLLWMFIENNNGRSYSLVVFPKDYTIELKKACKWCDFSDIEEATSRVGSTRTGDEVSAEKNDEGKSTKEKIELPSGCMLDFTATYETLKQVRKDVGENSSMKKKADAIEAMMHDCESGGKNCSNEGQADAKSCKVIQMISEARIKLHTSKG